MNDYNFDVKKIAEDCIQWIRNWFKWNGNNCNAVIGISGGKDSSIVATLCVEALGKDRVIGVLMPNGIQYDIDDAYKICRHLGIRHMVCNIAAAVDGVVYSIMLGKDSNNINDFEITNQTMINLPARIRMSTLYAISQSNNGRVANTCNLSEDYIGYSTRYGDAAGDFAPLSQLTSDEVMAIGEYLGLPRELVYKTPSDGLCGTTDEDNFGFTYDMLNKYIRTGVCEDDEIKKKIDWMHEKNIFKMQMMPYFNPDL